MKKYRVLCMLDSGSLDSLTGVEVTATDPNDAKSQALLALKKEGYPNAIVAPALPGAPVVMEMNSKSEHTKMVDNLINQTNGYTSYAEKVALGKELVNEISEEYIPDPSASLIGWILLLDFCKSVAAVDKKITYTEFR